jgi:hypothetical protein
MAVYLQIRAVARYHHRNEADKICTDHIAWYLPIRTDLEDWGPSIMKDHPGCSAGTKADVTLGTSDETKAFLDRG